MVEKSREKAYSEAKWRQKKKLDRFVEKKKKDSEPDLSGEHLKKWVRNISDREITLKQKQVLAKGLNFAVSPESIPVNDFVVATEQACWLLPEEERDQLRSEVSGLLRNAKPPP